MAPQQEDPGQADERPLQTRRSGSPSDHGQSHESDHPAEDGDDGQRKGDRIDPGPVLDDLPDPFLTRRGQIPRSPQRVAGCDARHRVVRGEEDQEDAYAQARRPGRGPPRAVSEQQDRQTDQSDENERGSDERP